MGRFRQIAKGDIAYVVECTTYYQDETATNLTFFTSRKDAVDYINRIHGDGRGDRSDFSLFVVEVGEEVKLEKGRTEIPQPPVVKELYKVKGE